MNHCPHPCIKVALKVEKDERNFEFYPSDDIFVVAALLKVVVAFVMTLNFSDRLFSNICEPFLSPYLDTLLRIESSTRKN